MELYTYQDFEKKKSGLKFEEADQIYSELVGLIEIAGPRVENYWSDFLQASVTYAAMRGKWLLLSNEQRAEIDDQRTSQHDNVIHTLNLVKRYLDEHDLESSWYEELTFNPVQARKRIGDFACYVSYVYGVNAR